MNITPPRDPDLAEFALQLFLMNQPGWPRNRGYRDGGRSMVVWPTLKSYQWMRQLEDNNHGINNGDETQTPPRDSA